MLSLNKRIKIIELTGILLVLTLGLIYSYSYIIRSFDLQVEIINNKTNQELNALQSNLEHQIKSARRSLENNHYLVDGFLKSKRDHSKTDISDLLFRELTYTTSQYNTYFALEKKYARHYYKSDGYGQAHHKGSELRGTKNYNSISNKKTMIYFESKYQTNLKENWYHIAKRSRNIQFSDFYFDETYRKDWMFTLAKGLYRGSEFIGMVGVDVLLKSFLQKIEDHENNKDRGIFILDSKTGRVLTEITNENSPFGLIKRNQFNLFNKFPWTKNIAHKDTTNYREGSYIYSSLLLEPSPWILISYHDANSIYKSVYDSTYKLVGLFGILLLLSIFLVISLARKLSQANQSIFQNSRLVALGEMSGGIAHEINSPLCIINGNNNLLLQYLNKNKFEPEKFIKLVKTNEKTINRIAKIIDGLKNVSRDGYFDKDEVTSVRAFVDDTLSVTSEKLKNNGVELIVEGLNFDLKTRGCRVQLSQVILNLVSNAYDAVIDQQVKWIKLEVEYTKSFITISLSNSGKKIGKEINDKIFNPFFTTKDIGKGTGLGLSICHRIVKEHGGNIELDRQSKHTQFNIKLNRHLD